MVVPISHISPGDSGRIVWIASPVKRQASLASCGVQPDADVNCVMRSPHGKILGFRVNQRLILLRRKTANEIFIELKSSGSR